MAFADSLDTVEARMLPISKIEPRIGQPRTEFDEEAIEELAESIAEHGLLQPLLIRPVDSGYYEIIAGERRWRASRLAGLSEVPVRIIHVDDKAAQELALIENLQRKDLTPLEEARGYKVLIDEYGMTQDAIAQSMGKSRPAITNALRLLSLPPAVADMVEKGAISPGHGRTLLSIGDADSMLEVASVIVERELTVRETEKLVASQQKRRGRAKKKASGGIDYAAVAAREIGNALGRKVTITCGAKKGKVEIEFYDPDDRESLLAALKKISLCRN